MTHKSMQVGTSLQNYNLCTDLKWVAKQIPKFQKVVNFTHLPMTWDQLALSYQTVKNLHQPASVWNWAPPKSTQVEWNTRWIQVENLYWLASLFEARALAGLHMNYSCNKVIADVLMIVTRIPQNCHCYIQASGNCNHLMIVIQIHCTANSLKWTPL